MDGHRNAWTSVAVWAIATVAGIAVCWWGIRPVLDAVVPDRLVAFPTVSQPSPPPPVPAEATTPPTAPSPSVGARSHSAAPRSPVPTSSSPAVTPSTVDGWTVLPNGSYVRTFELVGGTVTVQAGAGAMELVSATPKPAYVMTVTPTASTRVVVNFTGLTLHVSTLDARWVSNAPTAAVTEFP